MVQLNSSLLYYWCICEGNG